MKVGTFCSRTRKLASSFRVGDPITQMPGTP